jgi:multidrug efflux pump subunit AcrA (membrane-fusion protein)
MNYEVSVKPYLKGAENVTVVAIKMENNGRYSFEQVELHGDHTQDNEATLIQAVLDHIRTELDPTSAIVQAQAKLQETQAKLQETQAKLEQAEQKATQTETKQNEQAEIMNLIRKVVRVMAQDSIMGEKISYGTTYKEMVELFPLAEVGKVYEPGAIFAVEDPSHVEVNGEGKRILIQTNQSFTYQGETLTQLEGTPFQNGVLTTWKFNVPKAPIGQ